LGEWDAEINVVRELPSVGGSIHRTRLHVFGNGEIVITASLEPGALDLPDLPKSGLSLTLPRALDWISCPEHTSPSTSI
jgi:hypothetical protein